MTGTAEGGQRRVPHHESRQDGRALRSVRSRRAVVEAFIDLVNEGEVHPTAQQVADRSGVSPSTIFRLFEDLEGMYAEALSVQTERVSDLLEPIPGTGTVEHRVALLVRSRARLYERVAPLLRFQTRSIATSPGARSNRAAVNSFFRAELAELFASEFDQLPPDALDAVDTLTSWEMWERLRTVQGFSARRAQDAICGWVRSMLGT